MNTTCWGNQGGFLEEVAWELGLRDGQHGRGQHSRLRESLGQRLGSEGAQVQFDEPEDEERSQGHKAGPLVAEPALGSSAEIWHQELASRKSSRPPNQWTPANPPSERRYFLNCSAAGRRGRGSESHWLYPESLRRGLF